MLTAQLLFHKPENPREFIVEYLENVKQSGTQPLISKDDLATMFGMFDVVKRGTITAEQANNALRSILGNSAQLEMEPNAHLSQQQFVDVMHKALSESVPYRQ